MVGHHLGAMLKSASAIGRAPGRNRGTAPGTTIRRRPDEAESTSPIRTLLKRASKLSLTSLLSSSSASSSAVALGVDGENNLPIGGNHPVIEIGGGGQGRLHRSASSSEYSTSLVEEGGDLRVLFLGCGDSGKTTFQKQLRRTYHSDISEDERRSAACIIIHHLIWGVEAILDLMQNKLAVEIPDDLASDIAKLGKARSTAGDFQQTSLTLPLHQTLVRVVKHTTIQRSLPSARSLLDLPDCFYRSLERLVKDPDWGVHDWLPHDEEILAQHIRTSGIVRSCFETMDLEQALPAERVVMYDTGGQRCERRKWQHVFEAVDAVFFFASLAEYDRTLYEDPTQNRLEESVSLFQELLANDKLAKAKFTLVLTKRDEFYEKLVNQRIPLNASGRFPDAPEGFDYEASLNWIKSRFESSAKPVVAINVISCLSQVEVCEVFESARELCSSSSGGANTTSTTTTGNL